MISAGLGATGLRVIKAGVFSVIEDLGRFGVQRLGMTTGGPLDDVAFRWANRLCANANNAAALEVCIGGLELEAAVDTVIAVTGAPLPLSINGVECEHWRSHRLRRGDRLSLGYTGLGCRAYLAVRGGLTVTPHFGSCATVVREQMGGLNGGPLCIGDVLPCSDVGGLAAEQVLAVPEAVRPRYGNRARLRVIPAYQRRQFSREQRRLFYSSDYRVSEQCDRMGYRLSGPAIKPQCQAMLSEGIARGAIQLPADGQPIVLLNDRQTIGGYPKIGSLLSLDVAKLAQLTAGASVSFEPISMQRAHECLRAARRQFETTPLLPV